MQWLGKFLLDYLWGKLVKELLPWVIKKGKDFFKGKEIDKEVDKEEDEIKAIREEIRKYMADNPKAKRVPQSLELKLRAALRKRNSGLSK